MQNAQQLAATANQTNAQSNQLYNSDVSNAQNYQGQYNQDVNASNQASQNVQNQIGYMQGAGSGQNMYNQQLQGLTQQYDPNIQNQLSSANSSLFGLTGAMNGANQSFNTPGGVGAYGLSSAALGGYENSVLNPLQQGVSNANTQVSTLNNQLGTLMTGANQATTSGVQTEQSALTGLQSQYTNALAQQAQAQSQMQFYSQLASTQQGLTASQAAAYAQAQSAFTSANAAMTTAEGAYKQATAQAALTNQNVAANKAYMAKYGNTGGIFGETSQKTPAPTTPKPAAPTPLNPSSISSNSLVMPQISSGLGGIFAPSRQQTPNQGIALGQY